MAKIKRSQFKTFIDTTPATPTTYELIGEGVASAEIAYNPETSDEHYIHEDSGNSEVEGYKPNMPVESTAIEGDAVFEYIDGLRKARAVLDDAKTTIVNVWLYETPVGDEYPAEQQEVSVAIDTFGGEGGQSAKINYTLNYKGDPVLGTFDPTTKEFTPA